MEAILTRLGYSQSVIHNFKTEGVRGSGGTRCWGGGMAPRRGNFRFVRELLYVR
ncbi:hypothetical protein HOLleu_08905 [Holothuria leucospilota]|uniref:Uncharacterized protein n=1 Tax=Holothuria leucospilota TaxID=206669 RepID=A0A9Q1HI60_HOLLE|nr:hypothetical protein HOLleu_08905 [Holothuria leucospilota]